MKIYSKNNNVFIQNKKGQAILELAIFGSILIMLLGVLISYGLRYNYQQLAMQRAFREALGTAVTSTKPHKPISVSHLLIEDRHVPDSTHAFAVGSMMPFSSAGSVTRSAKMHETPDFEDELPESSYHINGATINFKTAGFRQETNVAESSIARYLEVYGTVQSWGPGGWVYWKDGFKTCIDPPGCTQYSFDTIRYIDECAGEIMSYDSTKRQCRKIIDSQVCEKDCERGGGTDCATTCAQEMALPWYCGTQGMSSDTDYVEINATVHTYDFPFLDKLFAFSPQKIKSMGLQEGYLQQDQTAATLDRTDNTARAETKDIINIKAHSHRRLVSKTYGDTTTNTNSQTVATDSERKQGRIWRTPWD
jgi:Flp pilus assembly protein TadG